MNTTELYRAATTPPKPGEDTKQQVSPDEAMRQQAIRLEYESWIQHAGTNKFLGELTKAQSKLLLQARDNPTGTNNPFILHRAKILDQVFNAVRTSNFNLLIE